MSRVKLKFPEQNPLFITTIPVRVGDLNYGNHVGNDAILSIIHEARMQWLGSHGYTELNIEGLGLIMADVMIAYKGESFYGDKIDIQIFAEEIMDASFDLLYRLTATRAGVVYAIAHGKTGMVSFDYGLRKITPLSVNFRRLLTA